MADLNPWLVAILRCPSCGRSVAQSADQLRCVSGHEFPIVGGVPVLLPGEEAPDVAAQHLNQREFYDQVFHGEGAYKIELWQRAYVNRLRHLWEGTAEPFLDVGAGDAYTVIEAGRDGVRAVGCDLSLEGMRRGRRLAEAQGVSDTCAFVVCLAEKLPFRDSVFASAASVHVLEHLTDDRGALDELARVTRPAARVFIGVPNSFDHMPALLRPVYRWHDRRIGHLRQYSAADLEAKAAAAGFRKVRLAFSAHWVKVWQLAMHLAASRVHVRDDRLWWWLEGIDERAGSRENGLHVNLFLERL
jgi:ubiquinone/menaquinone biosynthesis C-methylase UbiE/uncharacterized protein YbaR (Trm112 family)